MMMKKEKPTIPKIALLALVVLFATNLHQNAFADASTDAYLEKNYIYDKNFPPKKIKAAPSDNPYLSGGNLTAATLGLFQSLEKKFAVNSLEELGKHYEMVRQDLLFRFNEADAQKLYHHYQKYLACQILMVNDGRFRTESLDPKELLALLYQMQRFRREKLGQETADTLFGKDVKEQEYIYRRLIIIGHPDRYGKEKEKNLQKLKDDMWGQEPVTLGEDQEPYNLYQLKMQLYAKDLSEMDKDRQRQKIEEFRKEFFTPEQIKRMHEAEAEVAAADENLKRYRSEEKKILEATSMSPDHRNRAIKALQDQYFGSDADAFRRREAMQKSLEKK